MKTLNVCKGIELSLYIGAFIIPMVLPEIYTWNLFTFYFIIGGIQVSSHLFHLIFWKPARKSRWRIVYSYFLLILAGLLLFDYLFFGFSIFLFPILLIMLFVAPALAVLYFIKSILEWKEYTKVLKAEQYKAMLH